MSYEERETVAACIVMAAGIFAACSGAILAGAPLWPVVLFGMGGFLMWIVNAKR